MNINNDMWLIEDSVLKEYRDDSPVVHIPDGVRVIDNKAFARNNFIKRFNHNEILEVKFPNTLQEIREQAFYNCDFETIELPDSVTVIKSEAFAGCKKLRNFKVSNATFGLNVFSGDMDFNMSVTPNVRFNSINYGIKYISIDCNSSNVKDINSILYSIKNNCRNIKHISIDNINYEDIKDIHFDYVINENTLVIIKDPATNTSIKIEKSKLTEYVSDKKDIILPEGITILGEKVFYYKNIKQIKLPTSLKVIEEDSLVLNYFEYIEIPQNVEKVESSMTNQCGYNPLSVKLLSHNCTFNKDTFYSSNIKDFYFHISTIFVKDVYSSYDNALKDCTYHIDCKDIENIEIEKKLEKLVKTLKTGKKIILYNSNLTKMDIDRMTFLSLNVELKDDPNILKSVYEDECVNKEKNVVKIDKKNIEKDKDIEEKITNIEELIKDIKDEDKISIKNKVEDLLEKFRCKQDSLEPTIDFESDFDIKLEIKDDIISLKATLLASLDMIINTILLNNNDLELIKKINAYKELLNDKNTYKPSNTNTLEDKIKYIKYVVALTKSINENIKIDLLLDLENILDEIYTSVSKRMGTSLDDRLVINSFIDYEQRLIDDVEKVFQKATYNDLLIGTFLGNLDTDLADIFNNLNDILDELDEENKNKFQHMLNELLIKYLNVEEIDIAKITTDIARDLNPILLKLKDVSPLIGKHNIIDSLRNSKKILNGEIVYYNNEGFNACIEEFTREIYETVKFAPDIIVEKTNIKINEVIDKYLSMLLNNEQVINKKMQFYQNILNFNEEQILYFMILSDLVNIRMIVDSYFVQKDIYERRKVNI